MRLLSAIPAILAAIVATAFLSASEARAVLTNGPAMCEGLGTGSCIPSDTDELLMTLFTVSDNDPLFNIFAKDNSIILAFPDPVTGRDLDTVGFRLSGVVGTPPLVEGEITDVDFLNFNSPATTRPFVTNDNGTQTIQWTLLTDADPQLGSIVRINLSFVPEPGITLLMGLGLAGVGIVGRSRRE